MVQGSSYAATGSPRIRSASTPAACLLYGASGTGLRWGAGGRHYARRSRSLACARASSTTARETGRTPRAGAPWEPAS
eukprot:4272616-Lingulodinium_polyedra.AAC.1